jgi:predicted nucleic acid-binding protein
VILIDANVLIALVNEADEHHLRARRDGNALGNSTIYVTTPVLAECCFYLSAWFARKRLFDMLDQLSIRLHPREREVLVDHVKSWLHKYAEHQPDFADAHLIQLSELDRKAKIWTYDEEFRTIWRRLDGSRVPMAVRPA